ncbi:Xaa-Pro aminopeptidase [Desulfocicer vacuolatum DSM 3385]|uniref:Xaa-Pro aminopeptidase n=1 Tax=Desulfocicer vacuolatum DSM 3385 TaxID=1121400 RepID=A0A1W2B7M9_9BACT|nr:aminopeptidase P family protein [Desulfocicer vacuolatum]SMC68791.1 Xaa-Pro aminopeptidase [Desulfocicer vacuolatum DSM 3385]
MKTGIEKRINRLKNKMAVTETDTLILFSDENRRYFSGFTGEDGSYDESAGILIITREHLILATDSRFETQAAREAEGYEIHCYKKSMAVELPHILKKLQSKNIGLESDRLTHALYTKIEKEAKNAGLQCRFQPEDTLLKNIRVQKDDSEIKAIKKALAIAETSFLELREMIHPGMTEKKAAWLLEKFMRQNGADALSFPVIAASGKNSALPHAIPGDRAFNTGEPLLFDFGVRLDGYCSDTTRTLVIGSPDDTFKEAYEILNTAQQMAVDAIAPGIKCSDIDKIARNHIDSSRFKGSFGHSLGHGVGLAIHEAPRLSSLDDSELKSGMVVTVEPGIYLPQWGGIRLENMILVTENGAEVLNTMGYDNYRLQSL